jgi:DNA-binding IclR family transcriptional regulator
MTTQAIRKTMGLLDKLMEHGPLGLEELHILSQLPKPTVKRLLDDLVGLGWLYRHLGDRRYCLLKPMAVSEPEHRRRLLAKRLAPLLRELHGITGFCSDIALDLGDGLEVIESNYGLSGARLATRYLIGLRPNTQVSAIGRAYAARRVLEAGSPARLRADVERELRRGIHRRVPGIWEHPFPAPYDIRGVAVPIMRNDAAIGALNLYWDAARHGDAGMGDRYQAQLESAAARIAGMVAGAETVAGFAVS